MAPVLSFGMCRLTYSSASPVLAPVSGNVKKKIQLCGWGEDEHLRAKDEEERGMV